MAAVLDRFLRGAGIDPQQGWRELLPNLLFKRTPPGPWGAAGLRRLRAWFPHVDFARPRASDILRILLQLLWLALVKPQASELTTLLDAARAAR